MVGALSDLPHCRRLLGRIMATAIRTVHTYKPIWAAGRVSHVFNLAEGWSFANRKVLYLADGNIYEQ